MWLKQKKLNLYLQCYRTNKTEKKNNLFCKNKKKKNEENTSLNLFPFNGMALDFGLVVLDLNWTMCTIWFFSTFSQLLFTFMIFSSSFSLWIRSVHWKYCIFVWIINNSFELILFLLFCFFFFFFPQTGNEDLKQRKYIQIVRKI